MVLKVEMTHMDAMELDLDEMLCFNCVPLEFKALRILENVIHITHMFCFSVSSARFSAKVGLIAY